MCQLRNLVYSQLPKKKVYQILLMCVIFGVCYVTMETLLGSSLHDHEDEFWRIYADDPFPYGSRSQIASPINSESYLFNCANVHSIEILQPIGHGVIKQGYLGVYKGIKVVVKKILPGSYITYCENALKARHASHLLDRCSGYPPMKIMKEILLMHEIKHQNIARLLGYCVRNQDLYSPDLRRYGVLSVYEYGSAVTTDDIVHANWTEKLRHAIEMSSLLNYFAHSPLGSLRYPDLKMDHFVMIDGHLKLFDLDAIVNNEMVCSATGQCLYGVPCQNSTCPGSNIIENLTKMYNVLFTFLLEKKSYPNDYQGRISYLRQQTSGLYISAGELENELISILVNYTRL